MTYPDALYAEAELGRGAHVVAPLHVSGLGDAPLRVLLGRGCRGVNLHHLLVHVLQIYTAVEKKWTGTTINVSSLVTHKQIKYHEELSDQGILLFATTQGVHRAECVNKI